MNDILNWIQSACMDMAGGNSSLAENYYEDPEVLRSLVGDSYLGDPHAQDILLEAWEQTHHKPLKQVCRQLLIDHFGFDPENV